MGIIWCHLCPAPSNRPLWKRKVICPIRFLKPHHQLHQCHLEFNPRASKLVEKRYGKVDFMFRTFSTSWWPWFFWAEYEAESGTLDSASSTITGGLLCWGNVSILLASEGLKFVLSKTAGNLLEWPSEWAVVPNTTCPIDWSLQLLHLVDALHGSLKQVSEGIFQDGGPCCGFIPPLHYRKLSWHHRSIGNLSFVQPVCMGPPCSAISQTYQM